jgi:Phage portal protein, SPP1 Gp6-like
MKNKYIDEAIDAFRRQSVGYAKSERYYAGRHDLAFATEKFLSTFGTLFREFALNLCPAVCDAVRDKLRVTGFSVEAGTAFAGTTLAGTAGAPACTAGSSGRTHADIYARQPAGNGLAGEGAGGPGDRASRLRRIWNSNRMRTRAGEVHKEALKCGDAYVIVWPNAAGDATLYPNRAGSCTVEYDPEQPGRIVRAAKYWHASNKHVCLNLFYPDRIEKYVSKDASDSGVLTDASAFVAAAERVVANPFGVVPVFHFANNADLGDPGRSELEPAIAIQDGLNKSVLDMLVAMEYSAFRQRWAAGIDTELDASGKPVAPFTSGVEHVWVSENADTRFGDFNTADLNQFLKVKDSFRVDMALVTGTPLHYFTPNIAGTRSSDSLRRTESRFIAKVRDRQESFGQVWADVMAFALKVEGATDASLLTLWEDPSPLSDREMLENIILKMQIGLPAEQALIEAGYGAADTRTLLK